MYKSPICIFAGRTFYLGVPRKKSGSGCPPYLLCQTMAQKDITPILHATQLVLISTITNTTLRFIKNSSNLEQDQLLKNKDFSYL
ncbi:hypothetical protein AP058_01392 [Flavobacterium sp. TAB 87]|nr:hypothetical protein AP058_01392 [Flavobacterium sp. TAB 87]